MALPDDFLKYEIQQIISLQENFKGFEGIFKLISLSSSPTTAQFVTAPVVTALMGGPMVEAMVNTAAVDYSSIILKLLTSEHRPFWYVNEPVYAPGTRPKLRHFDITCETTSGGPSGHSAMMTAMAHMFRDWPVKALGEMFDVHKQCFNIPITSAAVILVFLCWASRMYFATHFMHQCVSGTGLALSVITTIQQDAIRRKLLTARKKKAIGFAIGTIVSAGAIYFGMSQLGMDPMWSVNKALKSCEKSVKLDWETTPMYTLSRNLGCILGISLCAPLRKRLKPVENWSSNLKSTLGLVLIDTVILANAPQNLGGCMYLAYVFGASVFHTYAMIKIVPWLANKLDESAEPPPPKEESKPPEGEGDTKPKDDAPKEEAEKPPAEAPPAEAPPAEAPPEAAPPEEPPAEAPPAEEPPAEEPPAEEPPAEEAPPSEEPPAEE